MSDDDNDSYSGSAAGKGEGSDTNSPPPLKLTKQAAKVSAFHAAFASLGNGEERDLLSVVLDTEEMNRELKFTAGELSVTASRLDALLRRALRNGVCAKCGARSSSPVVYDLGSDDDHEELHDYGASSQSSNSASRSPAKKAKLSSPRGLHPWQPINDAALLSAFAIVAKTKKGRNDWIAVLQHDLEGAQLLQLWSPGQVKDRYWQISGKREGK
jgi:hypothetical protein